MKESRLSHWRLACAFSFTSLALVSALNLYGRSGRAAANPSVKFATQSVATTATRGRYNGKIVFTSDRQNDSGIKLWTMNSDGSNQTQLTFETDRGPNLPDYIPVYDQAPKWSPDGTKIAFLSMRDYDPQNPAISQCTIYIMDYQSRAVQRLALFNQLSTSNSKPILIGPFEWSPDGSKFALICKEIILSDQRVTWSIYTINIDGSGASRLAIDVGKPTWSPDGKQLAFSRLSHENGTDEFDVMNADGGNLHAIASFPLGDYSELASWSPNGSKLLLVRGLQSCSGSSCNQLYTINADGTDMTQLTYTPIDHRGSTPTWSPDGTRILFTRYAVGPKYTVYVVNADGSGEHEISNHSVIVTGDVSGDWQPLLSSSNDPAPSVLGFSEKLYVLNCPSSPTIEIPVMRGGNLNQTASCAYQTQSGGFTSALIPISFAPGEISKNIQVSGWYCDVTRPTTLTLFNNEGNTTFVGGVKNATVVFVDSNSNPIDNSAYFVRQQYRDFLNREPDASGWDFWINNMDSCPVGSTFTQCQTIIKPTKRVDTSAAFFISVEFQQTGYLVYRTYKVAYGNLAGAPVPIRFNELLPDTQQIAQGVVVGQSGWEQALETNKQNFMTSFVQRSRFASAYPNSMTVQQFVDALYTNAGIVPTSAPNRPKAISEFNSTTPADPAARARALRDVAEDAMLTQQEFNRAFVLMQYFGYLRRNPNDAPD